MNDAENRFDLVVVGGGAAGFFGALAMAEARPHSRILILEKGNTPLSKVRVSGGGRCNVTHNCFDPQDLVKNYPRGGQALLGAFYRFQPADTLLWFESRGVALKAEPDGRIFPVSDSSESIVRCFFDEADRLNVTIRKRAPVEQIEAAADRFRVVLPDGETLESRLVLLATGGERQGFALAGRLGHSIVLPVPSLFTFHIADPRLNGLAGVSVADAKVTLPEWKFSQRGPLLVTHWGVSGPAVIRLSAWAARTMAEAGYHARLQVNWLPVLSTGEIMESLQAARSAHSQRQIAAHDPIGLLPGRLWRRLVEHCMPENLTWANASNRQLAQLVEELTRGEYPVSGKSPFKDEFVTAGGVSLNEVDFRTMESRIRPGLFLAGEVLDADGLTGGFNFQNAWTTGWIAGQACARRPLLTASEAG